MAEQVLLPGVTDDEQATLSRLLNQLNLVQARNQLRDSYYDGRRAITQVGSIIPPSYYKLAIVLGWSAKAVDTLADRCNLDGFVWPEGDLNSLGMREVWEGNYFAVESASATTQSLLHGVSFLINTVGDPSKGEPRGCIHVKDAAHATGTWDARGRRLSDLLSITERDWLGRVGDVNGIITGLALYLDDYILEARKDPGSLMWEIDRTPNLLGAGVPAEPMVYNYRAGRPFGYSRISRPVMSLHDQALRTVIRMEGHADVYSWPEMWLLGADESIFKNADGSQKVAWQVMLGRIKAIPDDDEAELPRADVKQFPASSPLPHIDQLRQQAQLFSGETSIPLTSLGVSDMSNPTSAESYIASREDLIARAEACTDGYTRALQRTIKRALAMQNGLDKIPDEWATVTPKWRNPIYLSRAAAADAGMKQLAAVPWLAETEVGLELLGLSDEQIARAMSDKSRAEGQLTLKALAQRGGSQLAKNPPEQQAVAGALTQSERPNDVNTVTGGQ